MGVRVRSECGSECGSVGVSVVRVHVSTSVWSGFHHSCSQQDQHWLSAVRDGRFKSFFAFEP